LKTAIVPENLGKKDLSPESFEKVVINNGTYDFRPTSPSKKYDLPEVNTTSLENFASYGLLPL